MTPFKQDIRAEWAIEQRVLKYLSQHGRKSWDVLLTRLSLQQETAIAPVLNALKERGYIEVAMQDHAVVVGITSSGLKLLEAKSSDS
jgi:predicted transcriptional regulator